MLAESIKPNTHMGQVGRTTELTQHFIHFFSLDIQISKMCTTLGQMARGTSPCLKYFTEKAIKPAPTYLA